MNQEVLNITYADIQGIGHGFSASADLVSIGKSMNFLLAFIAEIQSYEYQAPNLFAEDIRERIAS